jgi:hypothetical protein
MQAKHPSPVQATLFSVKEGSAALIITLLMHNGENGCACQS